jgi:integrase
MRRRTKNKHLPPCVYLHHGAYFHVKAGRWSRLGTTLQGALAAYARIHEQPNGGMTDVIDAAIATWDVKPSTMRQYKTAAAKLKKILAEFSPDQVKSKHVAQIKVALRDTPNMANRILSVLRQGFSYALEQGLVETNPVVGIERHKEAKRKRLITADEYGAIYLRAGQRLQVIMDLLSLTGQRIGDVLRIHRTDLVDDGIRFTQEKTGAKLVVRWTPGLRAVVDRANGLGGNVRALTLLYNRRGKPPDYKTIHEQWQAACKAAGVADANLHDLRAMAITQSKKEGLDPTALAGHATAAQTVRYLRDREIPVVDGPSFSRQFDEAEKG